MAGTETHFVMDTPKVSAPTKLLIVVSPYYKDIADNLLAGARAEIEAAGATCEVQQKFRLPFGSRTGRGSLTAMSPLAASFVARPRITRPSAMTARGG